MASDTPWGAGPLSVSADGRYLRSGDGSPFFWLADTAWLMVARLRREEIVEYLDDRRAKGFNVCQVMLLHRMPQSNAYGHQALASFQSVDWRSGPSSESLPYWELVDFALERAEERGILLALVPVWGSIVAAGHVSAADGEGYGRWLGRRYRDRPNVTWLNGGDIRGSHHREVWCALGRAIKGQDPRHLMTFHPFGRTQSSAWFHGESWLDFNMFQSGHRRYGQLKDGEPETANSKGEDNWRYVLEDRALLPPKPTLDGEPSYEGIPQGLVPGEPLWTDADVRRYAYWSVFSGACGHTYGHSAVMQMHTADRGVGAYGTTESWRDALRAPGASQMRYLKDLMLALPAEGRGGDQSLVDGRVGERYERIVALRGAGYAAFYSYTGREIRARPASVPGCLARAWSFDPRDGSLTPAGEVRPDAAFSLEAREVGPGRDRVVVLESLEPDLSARLREVRGG